MKLKVTNSKLEFCNLFQRPTFEYVHQGPVPVSQPAIGVIGNIGFPPSRNKEELIIPPFTKDEFTRSWQ